MCSSDAEVQQKQQQQQQTSSSRSLSPDGFVHPGAGGPTLPRLGRDERRACFIQTAAGRTAQIDGGNKQVGTKASMKQTSTGSCPTALCVTASHRPHSFFLVCLFVFCRNESNVSRSARSARSTVELLFEFLFLFFSSLLVTSDSPFLKK